MGRAIKLMTMMIIKKNCVRADKVAVVRSFL